MGKVIILVLLAFALQADERKDLIDLAKLIEKYNKAFINGPITNMSDENLKSVNYYIKDRDFKTLLKLKERAEIIERAGDRRRWFVSKWQGKQPAIYLSAEYNAELSLENKTQPTDLKENYLFYFKNYCEFDGTIDTRYARIKKMRLTYFDAPMTLTNNEMDISISGSFKKIVSYDIELKEDEKIINAMQSFRPVKSTTRAGNIFAIQLKVLEVYPGEPNMPLCTSDYYMGYKSWGPYEEILKQIDELPELKGKRNPY